MIIPVLTATVATSYFTHFVLSCAIGVTSTVICSFAAYYKGSASNSSESNPLNEHLTEQQIQLRESIAQCVKKAEQETTLILDQTKVHQHHLDNSMELLDQNVLKMDLTLTNLTQQLTSFSNQTSNEDSQLILQELLQELQQIHHLIEKNTPANSALVQYHFLNRNTQSKSESEPELKTLITRLSSALKAEIEKNKCYQEEITQLKTGYYHG